MFAAVVIYFVRNSRPKAVAAAGAANQTIYEYTAKYTEPFLEDTATLRLERPEHLVKATDHIEDIPDEELWTVRQMLEAFPFEEAPRFLLRDNDNIYGDYFRDRVGHMGIDEVKVTQLGSLAVTTPRFSTPEYGYNTNTVFAGEAVTLVSTVTDTAGTPALQWQMADLSDPGAFINLPSGNGTNVNVDTSALANSVKGIRLVANDSFGNSVTSAVVTLAVNPAQSSGAAVTSSKPSGSRKQKRASATVNSA